MIMIVADIRCKQCEKLLAKINIRGEREDFTLHLKCPRCKNKFEYNFKNENVEDQESQG